jgi:hypothetical protein
MVPLNQRVVTLYLRLDLERTILVKLHHDFGMDH